MEVRPAAIGCVLPDSARKDIQFKSSKEEGPRNLMHDDYDAKQHLEHLISQGIEYTFLVQMQYVEDEEDATDATITFLRDAVRVLRKCSDITEFKVNFLEEKIQEGLTPDEAEEAYWEYREATDEGVEDEPL